MKASVEILNVLSKKPKVMLTNKLSLNTVMEMALNLIKEQQDEIKELTEELTSLREEMAESFFAQYAEATRSNQKQLTESAKATIGDYLKKNHNLTVCEKFLQDKFRLGGQELGEALNELLLEGAIEYVERVSGYFWRGIA